MIRKILSTVLCLLLVLALPLSSLAATEYTLTASVSDEALPQAGIQDLLDALSLKLLAGEQSGMLTVNISGTDVVSLAVKADENGVYVQSDALSEKPVYFSKEDIVNTIVASMQASQSVSEEEIAAVQASVNQGFDSIGMLSSLPEAMAAESTTVSATTEEGMAEAKEQIAKLYGNDPAMVEYINTVLDSMEITDGDYTDAAHDPATQMIVMTVTGKDIAILADSKQMEQTFAAQAKSDGITEEEAKAHFVEMLNSSDMNIPIAIYTADEGETIVAMTMNMTMKGTSTSTVTVDGKTENQTEEFDVVVDMAYNRLTADDSVNHNVTMLATDKGEKKADGTLTVTDDTKGLYKLDGVLSAVNDGKEETAMTAQGELNTADAEQLTGWLAMLSDGTQITFDFTGKTTEQGKEKTIAVYTRQDATAIIAPAAADRPMFAFTVAINEQAAEEALAAISAADVAGSTQVLQMTSEEQTAWLSTCQANAMQALGAIIAVLPNSTMELFMSSAQQ